MNKNFFEQLLISSNLEVFPLFMLFKTEKQLRWIIFSYQVNEGKKKNLECEGEKNRSLWGKLPETPKITTCAQLSLNYFFKLLIASGVPVEFFCCCEVIAYFSQAFVCLSFSNTAVVSLFFFPPLCAKNFFPSNFFFLICRKISFILKSFFIK